MRIKNKYILFTTFIISLHLVFLFFFAFYFLQPQVLFSAGKIEQRLNENMDTLMKDTTIRDFNSLCKEIEANSSKNKLAFIIMDINSKVVYKTETQTHEPGRISSERIIKIQNEYFLIKSEESIESQKILAAFFLNQLLLAEVTLIFITVLISGAVMLRHYVNPLILLAKQMNRYAENFELPQIPKKRYDELGFLQEQFVALIQTIQKEKQKQLQLIASISHDIKTPLTSIMGYVERLVSKDLSEEKRRHYLQIIYSKAQHMNEIVNEFDEYTSYSLERSLTLVPYDVAQISEIILQEFSAELSDIHVKFHVVNKCTNQVLYLDLLKFKRVTGNLISNSLKHMGEAPEINVLLTPEKNGVQITFEDNGSGVDPADLPYIFDPLFTTDTSRKVAGLGLSICQNIIKSHDGTIEAYNKLSGGFGLSIWLPTTH